MKALEISVCLYLFQSIGILQYFGKISIASGVSTSLKKLYTFIRISGSRSAIVLFKILLEKYELLLLVVLSPHQSDYIIGC